MHAYDLILTLTGGLAAALILGFVTQRLGLSPIVGYLLAGTLVGPHTPGFVADSALAEQLAEIGVILLMFGVGLQFHIEELLAVRRVAIPGAVAQSAVATLLGALVAPTICETRSAFANRAAVRTCSASAPGISRSLTSHSASFVTRATFVAVGLDNNLLARATTALAAKFKADVTVAPAGKTY